MEKSTWGNLMLGLLPGLASSNKDDGASGCRCPSGGGQLPCNAFSGAT